MKSLDQLREITDETLGGLIAGQDLKHRIIMGANELKAQLPRRVSPRLVPILAGACALVLALAVGVRVLWPTPVADENLDQNDVFQSLTAGQATTSPLVRALDLSPGSIQLTASDTTPKYRSIWAPQNGGNFPLVGVNGAYYRLLQNPTSVNNSLIGSELGTVSEYTDEPSLSTSSIVSNTVAQGESVYEISGMGGAVIAAKVNGEMRAFQRVTYGSNATKGGESLADTLKISGKVVGMELSGVGTITDADTAASLAKTLTDNASYKNAGASSGDQSLLIQLSNGLTLQLAVKNGVLNACGGWTCPEFFDAFEAAVSGG